jgi:hypothetical protein
MKYCRTKWTHQSHSHKALHSNPARNPLGPAARHSKTARSHNPERHYPSLRKQLLHALWCDTSALLFVSRSVRSLPVQERAEVPGRMLSGRVLFRPGSHLRRIVPRLWSGHLRVPHVGDILPRRQREEKQDAILAG